VIHTRKRLLVTGITTIHGWPIWKALRRVYDSESLLGICPPKTKAQAGDNVIAMCITNQAQLQNLRDRFQPACIIHCAGIFDLDICEERPRYSLHRHKTPTNA
jgi:dTDP-4-dehydrorhamnose reductase